MRHTKFLQRMLSILMISACLIFPVSEANAAELQDLSASDTVVAIIKRNEGFLAYPTSDGVSGTYIGHGSRWEDAVTLFGPDCAPITEEQAEELTRYQLTMIDTAVNSFLRANQILVNQNQFDALVDFTYGVGIGWTTYQNADGTWCKLKELLLKDSSQWTEDKVQEAFGTWVYAGGVKLEGLVRRRAEEATLFMTPVTEQPERPSFTDVKPGDWFYETVQTANELGLMKGNGDGTFAPSQGLTRAQLVMALSNYAKADLPEAAGSVFTDVARTAWYGPAVAWAAENGYVNGYEDGSFRPDAIVTREQLCCVLGRYLRSQNISASAAGVSFTDDASISGYARQDVAYCAALGLVSGMPDGRFAPANGATRAETAAILVRMVGLG